MKLKFTFIIALLLTHLYLDAQNYLMDGTPITDCSGFFLDSGGGGGNYGANESFTTLICADGSTGTHIQLNFSGVDAANGDELCFYDGVDTNAPLLACHTDFLPGTPFIIQATAVNNSGCLTVTWTSDGSGEDNGWSAAIACIPACQLIEALLVFSDPAVNPADTGWIDICPGDLVEFQGQGFYPQNGAVYNHSDLTSTFEWDFGDGTFGTGPNAQHTYDEPGGYTVQLTITDILGCTNSNFISQRIRVAPPPDFTLGNDIVQEVCVGDTIQLDAVVDTVILSESVSVVPVEASFQADGVRSDSLPLPDGTGAAYETSIAFTNFSPGQVLTDINDLVSICVIIEHSYLRDLEISLTCPDGTNVILHNFGGTTGGEVFLGEPFEADEGFNPPIPGVGYEYCWTPSATAGTWLQYANANLPQTLPPGDYESFDPLTDFLGCPLNGEWTISVQDLWGVDNGYIFEWSIEFAQDIYPNLETFTPAIVDYQWIQQPSMFFYTQDSIATTPPNAGVGSYIFEVMDEFGCAWDTTVTVDILPPTHPDCYSCQDLLEPVPDTTICEGDGVVLDVSSDINDTTDVTFEVFPNYEFGFSNHPPNTPYVSGLDLNSISPALLTDPLEQIQSVCIDLETNFLVDIYVYLQAPNGAILELTTENGGTGDFYTNTCFTPDAAQSILTGSSPYTGNWQPEGNWADLAGAPITGTWNLLVADDSGLASFGTLHSWSITFQSINAITYSWNPATGLDCIDCPDPVATPLQTTLYEVTAQDNYSCLTTENIEVGVAQPVAAPTVDCAALVAGEIVFTWTAIDTFTLYEVNVNNTGWIPANGTLMHTLSGLPNGSFVELQVRVFNDGTICAADIGIAACITCEIDGVFDGVTPASCFGLCDGSMEVHGESGTSPYTYTIFHEADLYTYSQPSGLFTDLCPGLNIIVVEDASGCTDTVTAVVNEPAEIVLDAFQTQFINCNGGNNGGALVEATGGAGTYSYLWNDPLAQILPFATQLQAGTYTVIVTDANNCQATTTVDIIEPPLLEIDFVTDNVLCFGDDSGAASAIVTGGTYPYDYQWDDPLYTQDSLVLDLTANNYTVVVTDANGCVAQNTTQITQPLTPLFGTSEQTFISCYGTDNSQAVVSASGGTGPNYTFTWDNGQVGFQASSLDPGTTFVTITDQNNCQLVESLEIMQYDSLDILAIFTPVTCHDGNDGALAVTNVDGGTGSGILTYSWSINPGLNSSIISNLTGGQNYTVTVTDDQGCTNSTQLFLPQPPPITLETSISDVLCFGGEDGIASVVDVNAAVEPVTYLWTPTGQNTASASGLTAGFYTVELVDDRGCTAEATVQIQQPGPLDIDFEVVPNLCFSEAEGAVLVTAGGGVGNFGYSWSNGDTTQQIVNLTSGIYVATATDGNGCEIFDTAFVAQPDPINPLVEELDVDCFGSRNGRIELEPTGGTPPFVYSLDGVNYGGSSTLIGLEAGEYTVYIQDANDCLWIEEAIINEPPAIDLSFPEGDILTIELGDSIMLDALVTNAQGSYELFWEAPYEGTLSCTNCYNPIANSGSTIMYEVFVTDDLGCTTSAFITLQVLKERKVYVPTGFTPNNDGFNDILLVLGEEGTTIERFQIFDRWGELVFERGNYQINDPVFGWDGQFRGQDLNSGVYIWYLEVRYIDNVKEQFKGSSTLIR